MPHAQRHRTCYDISALAHAVECPAAVSLVVEYVRRTEVVVVTPIDGRFGVRGAEPRPERESEVRRKFADADIDSRIGGVDAFDYRTPRAGCPGREGSPDESSRVAVAARVRNPSARPLVEQPRRDQPRRQRVREV